MLFDLKKLDFEAVTPPECYGGCTIQKLEAEIYDGVFRKVELIYLEENYYTKGYKLHLIGELDGKEKVWTTVRIDDQVVFDQMFGEIGWRRFLMEKDYNLIDGIIENCGEKLWHLKEQFEVAQKLLELKLREKMEMEKTFQKWDNNHAI